MHDRHRESRGGGWSPPKASRRKRGSKMVVSLIRWPKPKPDAPRRDRWGHVRGDPHHKFLRTAQWQQIRRAFLAHHPLCEHCTLLGRPRRQPGPIISCASSTTIILGARRGRAAGLCAELPLAKSKWERGSQRRPLRLGCDPDGYPIELGRGYVETPERLAFLSKG